MTLILPMIAPPVQYSVQARQFLSRLANDPGATRKAAYAAIIDGLVANGVWAKLDVLYILAADTQANAMLNLLNSSYTCSTVAGTGLVFTANEGFYGPADNSGYVLSPYNFAVNGVTFTQNSAHLSVWISSGANQDGQSNVALLNVATSGTNLYARYLDFHAYARINDATEMGGFSVASSVGFTAGVRSGPTARQVYKNGLSIGTGVQASQSPTNDQLAMARSSNETVSLVSVGGALSPTDVSNFYAVLTAHEWW